MFSSKAERARGQVVRWLRCFTSGRGENGKPLIHQAGKGYGDGMDGVGEGKSLYHVHEGRKYPHIAKREGRTAFMGGAFFSFTLLVVVIFFSSLHISPFPFSLLSLSLSLLCLSLLL